MRNKKVLLFSMTSGIFHVSRSILSIIIRRIFILYIGSELLGLNSLFSSMVSLLSLTELGIGTLIVACLYEPIAKNDKQKIAAYLQLIKKIYICIGMLIFIMGLCITPYVHLFTNGHFTRKTETVAFVLFVITTAISYFFSYKKVMLEADQNWYLVMIVSLISTIFFSILQICNLLFLSDYFVFLFINLISVIFENLICSKIVDYKYPFLFHHKVKLDKSEMKLMKVKVKGILLYKISEYLIQGGDNLIVSIFLGTKMVAFYCNYILLVNMLWAIFSSVSTGAMAGLGNMLVLEKDNIKRTISNLLLIQHIIFSSTGVAMINAASIFVNVFFGGESILSKGFVLSIGLYYYIRGLFNVLEGLRGAAGLYEKDSKYQFCVACVNVIVSVILVYFWGISGVVIGTIICYLFKGAILTPIIIKNISMINIDMKWYRKKCIGYFLTFISAYIICHYVTKEVKFNSMIFQMISNICVGGILTFAFNVFLYRKNDEFLNFKQIIIRYLKNK